MIKKAVFFSWILAGTIILSGCDNKNLVKDKSNANNKFKIESVINSIDSNKKVDIGIKEIREKVIEFDNNIKENDKLLKDAYTDKINTLNNIHKEIDYRYKLDENKKKKFEKIWEDYLDKMEKVIDKIVFVNKDSSGKIDYKDLFNKYRIEKNKIIKWRNDELKKLNL